MNFRISPVWWPVMALSSPVLAPLLIKKNRIFKENMARAYEVNRERIGRAEPLQLPELTSFELTVLVEQKTEQGFLGSPGVSYLIKTDQGALLFDVGFGPETPVLAHNAAKLGFRMDQVDGLAISHLHPDHMGGMKATREKNVNISPEIAAPNAIPCYLPAECRADGFQPEVVEGPRMMAAGVASTGPLARSLFLMGWTEEQAVVARLKDKGLVVFTGCGHPTVETIVQMVKRLSGESIYAIGGGLHFPLTDSPNRKPGLKLQMFIGTGKPPWKRLTDEDLQRTIEALNEANPKHVFLSAHDTCDYALDRFRQKLKAETRVLKAGAVYRL